LETAGFFSKWTFSWLNPMLQLGYQRALQETDMYAIPEIYNSDTVSKEFIYYWEKELKKPK
jgi:hypothetical protein